MGMNYYLIKRPTENILETCDYWCSLDDHNMVERCPDGGYLWNGRYFKEKCDLERDYYLRLHIGKSSAGWRFGLAIYPEISINTLGDWKDLFRQRDVIIVDEEDSQVTPKEMIEIITKRKAFGFKATRRAAWEKEMLDGINDAISFCSTGSAYASYDDFLRKNYGVRGPHGLIAHDPKFDPNVIPPEDHRATYDYIKGLFY